MRTQMCLTGFALAQAARIQQIGGTSEQPNATTNLDDLELSQTTTTVEDWTPAEDVYDFDSMYAELWATPDDSDLEYMSSGWSLAQAGSDDPFMTKVYTQAKGLEQMANDVVRASPGIDPLQILDKLFRNSELKQIGITTTEIDVANFVDGLTTAVAKKTWKEIYCGIAAASKNIPVFGKFLSIGTSLASLAKKKLGGVAQDQQACRKEWNFKKFNYWENIKKMLAKGYDFGRQGLRMMTDKTIDQAGSIVGGLAFMVGKDAEKSKNETTASILAFNDKAKKIHTDTLNFLSEGLKKTGFKKASESVLKEVDKINNAEKTYLNSPAPANGAETLKKFRESFHDCPVDNHDYMGIICIRNGCPAGFTSCGFFCATENYCASMMNGTLTDMLSLTIQVGTILASTGLALANPMTIVSLVGGVTAAMDRLYHPTCDEREAYLNRTVVKEKEVKDKDTKSWRDWVIGVLGVCDNFDINPAEALIPIRKVLNRAIKDPLSGQQAELALDDLEQKYRFVPI